SVGGEQRGVVGVGDVVDYRCGGAVGAGDREGVGVGGAGRELVVGRARGVGPGAAAGNGEGAVEADGAGLRHEGGGVVDVGAGEQIGRAEWRGSVGIGGVGELGGEHGG